MPQLHVKTHFKTAKTLGYGLPSTVYTREDDEKEFVHKGLASRSFTRQFTLAEDVVVKGGKLENGILKVELERVIPEEDKPVKIKIS